MKNGYINNDFRTLSLTATKKENILTFEYLRESLNCMAKMWHGMGPSKDRSE